MKFIIDRVDKDHKHTLIRNCLITESWTNMMSLLATDFTETCRQVVEYFSNE